MNLSRRFWSRSVWFASLVVVGLLMLILWSVRWRQNSERERGVRVVRQQVVELLQRAEQNLNAGRTAAARKNYETVLELNPAEPVALLFMAGYLQQEGHSDDARALLARLGPVSEQLQATADFLLGGLELQSGRAIVGEQLLLSAHQRNSRYAAPLRDLARMYALQMRATEQNQMLLLLEQIRPLTKEELAMRLLAGRPITETKQATEQLRGYLQQAPDDRASLLGLLRTLRLDQSPQQVLAELDRHAELERGSATLLALRAILQLQSGADQVTSRYVQQLDVGQSADEEVWELAVRMAERAGDWEQMRRAAGWLVQMQPWQPAFRSFLALACERQGDTTEAQRQRVLMGRLDQLELLAWRMFRPQAEAESMAVPVMLELAGLLSASGEPGEARRWLSAAARLQPQNAEIAQQLAALSAVPEPERSLTESAPEMRPIALQAAVDFVQKPERTVGEEWKFVDESRERGVRFSYHNGQTQWKRIVETVGGGCAVLDLDGDLWPDLYFAQGQSAASQAEGGLDPLLEDQIFRNLRGQRFQNCTICVAETSTQGFTPRAGAPSHQAMGGVIRPSGVTNAVFRTPFIDPGSNGDVMDSAALRGIGIAGSRVWLRPDGQAAGYWWKSSPYAHPPTYLACFGLNNNWPGASSVHTGGGQFLMCDGSVRFISENLQGAQQPSIWFALHTYVGSTEAGQPIVGEF